MHCGSINCLGKVDYMQSILYPKVKLKLYLKSQPTTYIAWVTILSLSLSFYISFPVFLYFFLSLVEAK